MNPSPGAAVRALIRDEQGRILLLKRSNTRFFNGQWCLPGGKVDYGQRIEEAIIREVLEETSLHCLENHFLFFHESLPETESDLHYITFYFRCRVSGTVVVNDESGGFAWAKPQDLQNYKIPHWHREAIEKALLAK